jgi:hypothetical protein
LSAPVDAPLLCSHRTGTEGDAGGRRPTQRGATAAGSQDRLCTITAATATHSPLDSQTPRRFRRRALPASSLPRDHPSRAPSSRTVVEKSAQATRSSADC